MKMLKIQQVSENFQILDDDVCVYTMMKEGDSYLLKNAYQRKIAMLRPAKETFNLFQEKKRKTYDFLYETRNAGIWKEDQHSLLLQQKELKYSFYSGRMLGKDIFIGFENHQFIFQIDQFDQQATMFLKQPEYAIYAALYYLYFMMNDKPYSNPDDFLSHLPEDMMSFV